MYVKRRQGSDWPFVVWGLALFVMCAGICSDQPAEAATLCPAGWDESGDLCTTDDEALYDAWFPIFEAVIFSGVGPLAQVPESYGSEIGLEDYKADEPPEPGEDPEDHPPFPGVPEAQQYTATTGLTEIFQYFPECLCTVPIPTIGEIIDTQTVRVEAKAGFGTTMQWDNAAMRPLALAFYQVGSGGVQMYCTDSGNGYVDIVVEGFFGGFCANGSPIARANYIRTLISPAHVDAIVDSIEVSYVPEPNMAWMLAAGVVLLATAKEVWR